jgi:hypothetical protein
VGLLTEFTWDSRDLELWRGGQVDKALARATKKAGGKALRSMRTDANKTVREQRKMTSARVNSALGLVFPTSKEISRLAWKLDISGALVPVSAFPHRQTKTGVRVEIKPGNKKTIKSAFIARMASGHVGVFQRKGKARLPIKEAFTTRVSSLFLIEENRERVMANARANFESYFRKTFGAEVGRLRGKGMA